MNHLPFLFNMYVLKTPQKENKNFGLRYMEKCGWKQGDGLGSQRQGRNECVKTNYKNDNLGLGANVTQNEVMFKATMCMFNDILSRLSKKKPISNDNSNHDDDEKKELDNKPKNAMEAIRQYEAKHHLYGKFRAASDLSNKTESQKNAIFGGVGSSRGFSEQDQQAYAEHLQSLADAHKGHHGLGFDQPPPSDSNSNSNQFFFGKFVSSGIMHRNDIMEKTHQDSKDKDQTSTQLNSLNNISESLIVNDDDIDKKN